MRREVPLTLAAIALAAAVLGACGSSAKHAATPSTSGTSAPTVRYGSKPKSSVVSPSTAAKASAPEVSPAGDIPDNQVFVKFAAPDGVYSVTIPEGWARTNTPSTTTFSDHFNSIKITASNRAAAPTVATARASEVPTLQRAIAGFSLKNVSSVNRTAGPAVLVTYAADSTPDPVTGKYVKLDVERYEFWRNGKLVTLILSAPTGSDNVDPWKTVTNSFAWSQ